MNPSLTPVFGATALAWAGSFTAALLRQAAGWFMRPLIYLSLVFFALVMIAASILVGQVSIGIEEMVIVTLGLSAISVIGLLIAVFIGVGGLIEPRVLGVGYDTIHSLLRGELLGVLVVGLLVAKALVWSIALGSGTSGGVLAPLYPAFGGSAGL